MSRIAVIGSRGYRELYKVIEFVKLLPPGTELISGGARGVDSVAEQTMVEAGGTVYSFRPQQVHWDPDKFEVQCQRWFNGEDNGYVLVEEGFTTFPEAAFYRNYRIIEMAEDGVVAFWDGESRGTADGLKKAEALGRRIVVVRQS